MQPITSQKSRQRAKRDLDLVASQIADLNRKREESNAGFAVAEEFLLSQANEIKSAIATWDGKPKQTTLEAVK